MTGPPSTLYTVHIEKRVQVMKAVPGVVSTRYSMEEEYIHYGYKRRIPVPIYGHNISQTADLPPTEPVPHCPKSNPNFRDIA